MSLSASLVALSATSLNYDTGMRTLAAHIPAKCYGAHETARKLGHPRNKINIQLCVLSESAPVNISSETYHWQGNQEIEPPREGSKPCASAPTTRRGRNNSGSSRGPNLYACVVNKDLSNNLEEKSATL